MNLMSLLTHPLFIIFIVLAFIISNILLLKYTAHMKTPGAKKADKKSEQLEQLIEKSKELERLHQKTEGKSKKH